MKSYFLKVFFITGSPHVWQIIDVRLYFSIIFVPRFFVFSKLFPFFNSSRSDMAWMIFNHGGNLGCLLVRVGLAIHLACSYTLSVVHRRTQKSLHTASQSDSSLDSSVTDSSVTDSIVNGSIVIDSIVIDSIVNDRKNDKSLKGKGNMECWKQPFTYSRPQFDRNQQSPPPPRGGGGRERKLDRQI